MKKYINLVTLLALLLGLSAIPAVAQTDGHRKGVCKDQEGKPITDGVVECTNTDTGRKMTVKTNKNGEYHIDRPDARKLRCRADAQWQASGCRQQESRLAWATCAK